MSFLQLKTHQELWKEARDEDCVFPVFIHWFMRIESAVGKLFILLFFGWAMPGELAMIAWYG